MAYVCNVSQNHWSMNQWAHTSEQMHKPKKAEKNENHGIYCIKIRSYVVLVIDSVKKTNPKYSRTL